MNVMNKIIKLDPHMANLIAAGEVVERPSSVVKELVENAIDASASVIKVDLIDAGTKSIVVSDNGTGMDRVDAKMAFERHATSKIKSEDDLFRIMTLGFRGEALPSIAAVSQLMLKTSTDGLSGIQLTLKAGSFLFEEITPSPKGTIVTVNNLFFNTPARFKHIQSLNSELSSSIDLLNKFALAHPEISFTVTHNGKIIFRTAGSGDLLEVISSTYGTDTAKNMIYFENKASHYVIKGYASNMNLTRSSRNYISLLVNRRVIKNTSLVYAILDGYKNINVSSKFPVVVMAIEADPSLLDVNIHPSKLEIKFTDEEILKDLIRQTIYQALTKNNLIPSMGKESFEEILNEIKELVVDDNSSFPNLFSGFDSGLLKETEAEAFFFETKPTEPVILGEDPFIHQPKMEEYMEQSIHHDLPRLEYIGQFHGTYLLAQSEDHLYLIDQHAAMERIMYEKISNQFALDQVSVYELLIPFKPDFSLTEYAGVLEQTSKLKELGIEIDDFGAGSIMVRSVPTWLPTNLEEEFVRDVIEHLIQSRNASKAILLDSLAKSLSCKKSIKANMYVTTEEVKQLLNDLYLAKNPYTCPHGRPVLIKLHSYEIEKMFKRVV